MKAADCGADGVIVSNHGGRNLETAISPIEVLADVVDAVGKRVAVLADSGFRRGTDIVKALALGAHAVQVGRSTLYGVAAGGEEGARRAIAIFRGEIDRVMAQLGCNSIGELSSEHLHAPDFPLRADAAPRLRLLETARTAER
jgi:(S)-mandelate dehydrogenase